MSQVGQPRVVLRWRSKTIWDGCLNPAINMITIAAILKLTFFPRILGRGMRLMHLAKQCCNVTVAQLLEETKSPFVMIQLFEELVGGTGSKESQKTWISNSLAGTQNQVTQNLLRVRFEQCDCMCCGPRPQPGSNAITVSHDPHRATRIGDPGFPSHSSHLESHCHS